MARRLRTAANLASAVRSASRPGSPSLLQRVAALPRMIRAVRSGRYTGLSNGQLALMLAGLGYVLSPVDLVPEGLPLELRLRETERFASGVVALVYDVVGGGTR